jgi:hypothetical protein
MEGPCSKTKNASDSISKISYEVDKFDRHLDFLEMVALSEQFAWYHQLQEQFFREVS